MSIDEKDEKDVEHVIFSEDVEFTLQEPSEKLRQEWKIRQARTLDLMKFLEIPCTEGLMWERTPPTVSAFTLYDILMDEEKLRILVAKLRNKAFW